MDLEHLVVHEAPWTPILSAVIGIDVPSLCAFFAILRGSNPEHHSGDAEYDAKPCERCHVNDKALLREHTGLHRRNEAPTITRIVPRSRRPDSEQGGHTKKPPQQSASFQSGSLHSNTVRSPRWRRRRPRRGPHGPKLTGGEEKATSAPGPSSSQSTFGAPHGSGGLAGPST